MWKNKVLQQIGATKHQNFKYKHEQKTLTASRCFIVWWNSQVLQGRSTQQVLQGRSMDSFHQYLATADVEVRNFKKIRFFPGCPLDRTYPPDKLSTFQITRPEGTFVCACVRRTMRGVRETRDFSQTQN